MDHTKEELENEMAYLYWREFCLDYWKKKCECHRCVADKMKWK